MSLDCDFRDAYAINVNEAREEIDVLFEYLDLN